MSKIKVQIVGSTHGFDHGDAVEVDAETADRMLGNGLAVRASSTAAKKAPAKKAPVKKAAALAEPAS